MTLGCFTGNEEQCIEAVYNMYIKDCYISEASISKGKEYIEKIKLAFEIGRKRYGLTK